MKNSVITTLFLITTTTISAMNNEQSRVAPMPVIVLRNIFNNTSKTLTFIPPGNNSDAILIQKGDTVTPGIPLTVPHYALIENSATAKIKKPSEGNRDMLKLQVTEVKELTTSYNYLGFIVISLMDPKENAIKSHIMTITRKHKETHLALDLVLAGKVLKGSTFEIDYDHYPS